MAHAVIIDQMRRNVRARGGSRCVLPDRPSVVYERFVVARRERWARASVVTRASPRPTRPSPPDPVPHLSTRRWRWTAHPRQVSRRPPRPRALPRQPAPRDPRRRGAKARMVPNDVRDGGEGVPRGGRARAERARGGAYGGRVRAVRYVEMEFHPGSRRWPLLTATGEGDVEALEWLIQLFDAKGLEGATEASRSVGSPPVAARSRAFCICTRTGADGTGKTAQRRRGEATWRCSSGRVGTGARGTNGRAKRRGEATWRCSSGRIRTVPGGRSHVLGRGGERPSGSAAVGASERVPVERGDVRAGGGGGRTEVLQWARRNGCPWNARTCNAAAKEGHLEVLQWAHQNGCSRDELTLELADPCCRPYLLEHVCVTVLSDAWLPADESHARAIEVGDQMLTTARAPMIA